MVKVCSPCHWAFDCTEKEILDLAAPWSARPAHRHEETWQAWSISTWMVSFGGVGHGGVSPDLLLLPSLSEIFLHGFAESWGGPRTDSRRCRRAATGGRAGEGRNPGDRSDSRADRCFLPLPGSWPPVDLLIGTAAMWPKLDKSASGMGDVAVVMKGLEEANGS